MRTAQQPHLLPCTNATLNACLPLMQLPCLLTSVLPHHFVSAAGTVLTWLLVSVLGWMPLRCHLWYQLSHRLAWAHSLASAVGTSGSTCPPLYRGLPLSRMRTAWRVIPALSADPHRSDRAARGHLVQVDVHILGQVQLLNQLGMLIPQQAPRSSVLAPLVICALGAACPFCGPGMDACDPCAMSIAAPDYAFTAAQGDLPGVQISVGIPVPLSHQVRPLRCKAAALAALSPGAQWAACWRARRCPSTYHSFPCMRTGTRSANFVADPPNLHSGPCCEVCWLLAIVLCWMPLRCQLWMSVCNGRLSSDAPYGLTCSHKGKSEPLF